MRGINCAMRSAMMGGMVLVLSASPALAFGENKMVNEKPKVEIIKVEINKVDKLGDSLLFLFIVPKRRIIKGAGID